MLCVRAGGVHRAPAPLGYTTRHTIRFSIHDTTGRCAAGGKIRDAPRAPCARRATRRSPVPIPVLPHSGLSTQSRFGVERDSDARLYYLVHLMHGAAARGTFTCTCTCTCACCCHVACGQLNDSCLGSAIISGLGPHRPKDWMPPSSTSCCTNHCCASVLA